MDRMSNHTNMSFLSTLLEYICREDFISSNCALQGPGIVQEVHSYEKKMIEFCPLCHMKPNRIHEATWAEACNLAIAAAPLVGYAVILAL